MMKSNIINNLDFFKSFCKNLNYKQKKQKVAFICEKCGKEISISILYLLKKDKLICGHCLQSMKLSEHIFNNKNEWVNRWKNSIKNIYGVDNACFIPTVIEKKEKTNLKKYGTKYHIASKIVRKKIEKIFEEKYNGEHTAMKDEKVKEKSKITNKEKYGGWFLSTNRDKVEKGMKDKYGTTNISSLPEVQKKRKNTCIKKYGYETNLKSPENIKKSKITLQNRYGVDHPMKSIEIKKKIVENYGAIGSNIKNGGYWYNDIHFDSSYELAYYLFLKYQNKKFIYHPNYSFEYEDKKGCKHLYLPDFLVEGTFYEIKGGQFFNKKGEPYNHYKKEYWWEKYNLMLQYNVIILRENDIKSAFDYVEKTFGTDFLKSCKVKRNTISDVPANNQ